MWSSIISYVVISFLVVFNAKKTKELARNDGDVKVIQGMNLAVYLLVGLLMLKMDQIETFKQAFETVPYGTLAVIEILFVAVFTVLIILVSKVLAMFGFNEKVIAMMTGSLIGIFVSVMVMTIVVETEALQKTLALYALMMGSTVVYIQKK